MKTLSFVLSLLFAASYVTAQTVPVTWTSFDNIGSTAVGQLGPVVVNGSGIVEAGPTTLDLSTADFSAAPLSAMQAILEYAESSDFTFTFSHPVSGLMLYTKSWRTHNYTFSQPFTILSGLTGATVTGNTLATAGGFSDGIIQFSGPVKTLTLNNPTGSFSRQELTFAVVPRPTTSAIAGPKKIRTSRASLTLRGTASATFGVDKVRVKAGSGGTKNAKGAENWEIKIRPKKGLTRVSVNAVGFDGSRSATSTVTIKRR